MHRWVNDTPDDFVFDVKVHRLLSRHSAPLDSLPPDLRGRADTTDRGRVRLTPELEGALAERLVEETAPLAEAGKLGSYLVQLTRPSRPARGRRRAGRSGRGARPRTDRARAAKPRLGARGTARVHPQVFSERDVAFVCVDAPPATTFRSCRRARRRYPDDLAYLRLHGATPTAMWAGGRSPSALAGATRRMS